MSSGSQQGVFFVPAECRPGKCQCSILPWYIYIYFYSFMILTVKGKMYYEGQGCTINKQKAKEWLERAANQGNNKAQHFLREYC